MAWIKNRQPKRRGAPASRLTPRSQKKRSSAPPEPAPVPDVPSPLAELPAEGSRRAKQKFPAGNSDLDIGGNRDLVGDSGIPVGAPYVAGRRGGKRGATQR